jgi:hypothetical protein
VGTKRKRGKGRALSAKREEELCARFLAGESIRDLAGAFRVSRATVSNILERRNVSADQRAAGPTSRGGVAAPKIGDAEQHRRSSIAAYADLSDPPDDPLSAMGWLRHVYLVQLKQVATDPNYPGSESARRKEMRELGRAAAACKDEDSLGRVRDLLLAEKDRRERRGAEIVTGQQPTRSHQHSAPNASTRVSDTSRCGLPCASR